MKSRDTETHILRLRIKLYRKNPTHGGAGKNLTWLDLREGYEGRLQDWRFFLEYWDKTNQPTKNQ
jgi:hypothetical protein